MENKEDIIVTIYNIIYEQYTTNNNRRLMESVKQTAVEWLHEIAKQREPDKFDWQQAKEMEKEQIEDGFCDGFFAAWDNQTYKEVQKPESAKQYYNETYGGNK